MRNTTIRVSFVALSVLVVSACAGNQCTGDPRVDEGLLCSGKGVIGGGYQETIASKERELEAAQREQDNQLKQKSANEAEVAATRGEIARLQKEVDALDKEIASLQERVDTARRSGGISNADADRLEQDLRQLRGQSRRLDNDAQLALKSEAALEQELDDLKKKAAELEQLFDVMAN